MAYTTVADVKVDLNADVDDTEYDALFAILIPEAQAEIDQHCHRTFEAASDTTRYFDPTRDVDGPILWTYRTSVDLAAITTVTNGDGTVVTSGQYVTEPVNMSPLKGIRLKQNAGVVWSYSDTPENSVSVLGRWAYSVTAPPDIVRACRQLVIYYYRRREGVGTDADRTVITQDGTTLLPGSMPNDIKRLLRPYVRRL